MLAVAASGLEGVAVRAESNHGVGGVPTASCDVVDVVNLENGGACVGPFVWMTKASWVLAFAAAAKHDGPAGERGPRIAVNDAGFRPAATLVSVLPDGGGELLVALPCVGQGPRIEVLG